MKKIMKSKGFTLVEILVVVSIIGILAAILVPVVARSKTKAKIAMARVQMTELSAALISYKTDYGRYPMPSGIDPLLNGDVSFHIDFGDSYENDGVIGILTDRDHSRNPKKNKYLDIKSSGEPYSNQIPGLSTDGFYLDPFGNEYVITMDRNRDGLCFDNVYGRWAVSKGGTTGLVAKSWDAVNRKADDPNGNSSDFFAYQGEVMIWTAGPDRMASDGQTATDGSNADNILSWK